MKKLNYKNQRIIFGINCPDSFRSQLDSLRPIAEIREEVRSGDLIEFALAFAITQEDLNHCIHLIAPRLEGDAVFWCCYPKGTSKKYSCDFNRDHGWDAMVPYGLQGVRMVSIDEDWSALRFRKTAYIRKS